MDALSSLRSFLEIELLILSVLELIVGFHCPREEAGEDPNVPRAPCLSHLPPFHLETGQGGTSGPSEWRLCLCLMPRTWGLVLKRRLYLGWSLLTVGE